MTAKNEGLKRATPIATTPVSITTNSKGLELASLDDMWRFAGYVIQSGLAPKGIDRPEAVVVALQMGFELGLPPMQALQNIAVINGRPCVWGDAVPGLVESSGKQAYGFPKKTGHPVVGGKYPDDYGYIYTTKRVGRDEYSYTFTVADAKKASLWGKAGTWTFYPDRMLLNRARTFCLRDIYPDVLRGIITSDEATDIVDAEFTVDETKSKTEQLADIVAPPTEDVVPEEAVTEEVNIETGEVTETPTELPPNDKLTGQLGF